MHEPPTHFIDLEASGIAPDSYPIEVGVVYPGGEYQARVEDGSTALDVATEMNRLFAGQALCSDSPTDTFWLGQLFEAAGIEPTFTLRPIDGFVGKHHASNIHRLLTGSKVHRALPDARSLAETSANYFAKERLEWNIAAKLYDKHVSSGAHVREYVASTQRLSELVLGAVELLGLSVDEAVAYSEEELLGLLTAEYKRHPENNDLRLFLALKLESEIGL